MNYYIGMSEKQEIFTLLDGRVCIARSIYNPTSDAVWLAAFVPAGIKTVLDVGIGGGAVSLCLLTHNPDAVVTGLDISSDMLDICRKNMNLNGYEFCLINTDIMNWNCSDTFDVVVTNPPYFKGTPAKHNAHHNTDISDWVKRSCARVKPNGYFCIIIDALCLSEVVSALYTKHFGDIQILPLFGAKNTAERVLVRARLGVKTGTTLFGGFSMNNEMILRSGLTIDMLSDTLKAQ